MQLRALRYFVEIARCKSFTAAASKLFVSQPTLSRTIADLEEEFGELLFDRTTRHLSLTAKGTLFYQRACAILALVDGTRREMTANALTGTLTISAAETPAMALVCKAVMALLKREPAVSIDIKSANAVDAAADLRAGYADFGVFNLPADLEGFDHIVLPFSNRWGVLTQRDGPLSGLDCVTASDLLQLDLYVSGQRRMDAQFNSWLGTSLDSLKIRGKYNLLYNAELAVRQGAHALCIEGVAHLDEKIMFLPLSPSIQSGVVLAWPQSAVKRALSDAFLSEIKKLLAPACTANQDDDIL